MAGRARAKAKGSPTIAAAPPAPKQAGLKVSAEVIARSRARQAAQQRPYEPFVVAQHPPTVMRSVPKTLAQDEAIGSAIGWAQASLIAAQVGSIYAEGQAFPGYPLLALLAQRAEYRVISETIATEMTRRWIRIQASGDDDKTNQIKELGDEMERLNVRAAFRELAEQDGFFGRSHLYLDTGQMGNPAELTKPIGNGSDAASLAKVGKGDLKGIRVIEAMWVYPSPSYNSTDPLDPNWYRPAQWYAMGKLIDGSRLLTFVGREVPDLLKPAYSFGGLSRSQMAKPYVDNWLQTRQNVSDIISAFSVFVLKTNLSESLQGDGDQLFRRAELFNNFRSNTGLMMLDKESEDFQNISAPLGTLDKLQAQAQEHISAVARVPLVKLLGITPSGLNASSDGEIRVFYDFIHAEQESFFRPNLTRIFKFAQLNIWGEVDPTLSFEFEPLWALDETAQAGVRKTEAETGAVLIDAGVISPEEERKRVANDPDTLYQGLDIEDMPELLDEEEQGLEPQGGRPQPVSQQEAEAQGLAAPKGKGASDEAGFVESKHPRDKGQFATSAGASGGGEAAKLTPAQAKRKTTAWLGSGKVSSTLDAVAKTVATKVKDPEVIKGALGAALNAAIGHYWLGHTDFDAAIISESMQHIEVGLAVSAAQAKDAMRKTVDALIGAYRKKGAADEEADASDDEVLEALEALREALGDDDGAEE